MFTAINGGVVPVVRDFPSSVDVWEFHSLNTGDKYQHSSKSKTVRHTQLGNETV